MAFALLIISVLFFSVYSSDDSLAVRAILDSNNLNNISVDSVTKAESGRIVWLNLYNMGISTIPGVEIQKLTALRTLSLANNNIDSIPAEIGNLTMLRNLSLDDNRLKNLSASISNLTNLTYFSARHNDINDIPAEIVSMQNFLGIGYTGEDVIEPVAGSFCIAYNPLCDITEAKLKWLLLVSTCSYPFRDSVNSIKPQCTSTNTGKTLKKINKSVGNGSLSCKKNIDLQGRTIALEKTKRTNKVYLSTVKKLQ